MMTVQETNKETIKDYLLSDPRLFELSGISGQLEDYEVSGAYNYLLIKENNDILGWFSVKEFTKIVAECHINILSKYWGKDKAVEACTTVFNYLNNSGFIKVFTQVPLSCEHVIRLLELVGSKPCGMIAQGCVYRENLTDLLLYDYDLRGSHV